MRRKTFAACFVLACFGSAPSMGQDVAPRYLMAKGRELTYHNEAKAPAKGRESVYVVAWKVWAVDRDAEGAWRLVIRCDLKTKRGNPPAAIDRAELYFKNELRWTNSTITKTPSNRRKHI